jgi:uracil-DNA glycosylase family protein
MSPLERTPSYTAPGEHQLTSKQFLAEPQLIQLAGEAAHCQRCPLYRNATQAVFGEGPIDAALLLVGEQPGDQEDREGPFVGPADRILDLALEKAGLDRRSIYATNAVKHFKHEQRGKRRLHKRPNRDEVEKCRWWLDQELVLVKPARSRHARSWVGQLWRTLASKFRCRCGAPLHYPRHRQVSTRSRS